MSVTALIRTTRPPFLILAPICVLLGVASAAHGGAALSPWLITLIVVSAVLAHVSVNMLNEYFDFRSGLDLQTQRTPFSGGSGGLVEAPQMANATYRLGLLTLLLTVMIGLALIWWRGWMLLPLGVAGVVLIVTYTTWINRSPWLCLLAPGLGFGGLIVPGTHLVLSGEFSWSAWQFAAIPFVLSNNLLLLNQIPDQQADAACGRRTLPVVYGAEVCAQVYGFNILLCASAIWLTILWGQVSEWATLALLPLLAAIAAWHGLIRHGDNIAAAPQFLAANVVAALTTPLVFALVVLLN